jgi:limonene-1,2-epoxide hydrolase
MTPIETIKTLMVAFERLDFDALYELVDENIVYRNMPQEAIHGKAALRALFGGFGNVSYIRFELLNIVAEGNVVLSEHLDHLVIGERSCVVPMMSSFALASGKIVQWREYYDMPTFERQLGRTHPGAKP